MVLTGLRCSLMLVALLAFDPCRCLSVFMGPEGTGAPSCEFKGVPMALGS